MLLLLSSERAVVTTPDNLRGTLCGLVASATLTVLAGAILVPVVPQIQSELGVVGVFVVAGVLAAVAGVALGGRRVWPS
jgi:hypothetical protein